MPRKRTAETDIVISGGAAAVPRRQTAAKARAKRSVQPVKPAVEALEANAVSEPSPEDVARLAFSYWEARGCQGGSAEADWLRAEQDLCARVSAATA